LEKEGTGAQWGNLNAEFGINQDRTKNLLSQSTPLLDENILYPISKRYMNIAECMIMLYFDGIFYYFLAWYIDNVFPGEFGVPRKWYFFIQARWQ
jgi:hypothetical protein